MVAKNSWHGGENAQCSLLHLNVGSGGALEKQLKDVGPLVVAVVVDEIAGNFSDNIADFSLETWCCGKLNQQQDLLFELVLRRNRKLIKKG